MDPFARLGLERRPWLDPVEVRRAFQEQARRLHPDAVGGDAERFAELNAAQTVLGDSAARLRLLAEETPIPAMPPDAELGFQIGSAMRACDTVRAKLASTTNSLARILLAGEVERVCGEVAALGEIVEGRQRDWEAALRVVDARWPDVPPEKVAALAGAAAFLARWSRQLDECRLELAVALPRKEGSG